MGNRLEPLGYLLRHAPFLGKTVGHFFRVAIMRQAAIHRWVSYPALFEQLCQNVITGETLLYSGQEKGFEYERGLRLVEQHTDALRDVFASCMAVNVRSRKGLPEPAHALTTLIMRPRSFMNFYVPFRVLVEQGNLSGASLKDFVEQALTNQRFEHGNLVASYRQGISSEEVLGYIAKSPVERMVAYGTGAIPRDVANQRLPIANTFEKALIGAYYPELSKN